MRDDALPFARIVAVAAGIALGVIAAVAVALAMLHQRHLPFGGRPVAEPLSPAPGLPRLQSAPQRDLAAYRAQQAQALNGAAGVDATSATAHLPIAQAMALLAARAASASASRGAP